jgi:LysR family transcriptional regulator, glycine cleavage system transcriptional activator
MSDRLPPLKALRAFEAAARNGSLTRAARELLVTQGAVSRHVSQLERWLGVTLFVRTRRGAELTQEGTAYFRGIRPAFQEIELHTRRLLKKPDANLLRLKLPPTFAIRWLVPRLARFHAQNRHIDVQITTSHQPVDFEREDVDVAIHSGPAPLTGVTCQRLFGEVLLPVCSPSLFKTYPRPKQPSDLVHHVLLCSMHRPNDWPDWLMAARLSEIDGNSGLKFENSALAYQAAIDELGIVMAQYAFVEDDLRTGRLVEPFSLRVPAGQAYFIAYPYAPPPAKVKAFEIWIKDLLEAEAQKH